MPGFTESNITLDFPDANFFQFSNCRGYKELSGYNFKEMDACWYDMNNNLYWLIELKDFTNAVITLPTVETRALNLLRKAVDSMCMFLSSKHAYPHSIKLNPCMPVIPNAATAFKLISIIHCKTSQTADVQFINETFKRRFKPYATLFGITHYSVLEHAQAIRLIPHNMIK